MQPDIDKYINAYVNILLRLFLSSHIAKHSLARYARTANKINDKLRKIKYDYGLAYLAIVIHKVSVITNYSFGPSDKALINEIVNEGCVVTKLNIIDIGRNTRCLINI